MSEMPSLRYTLHDAIEDRHWWFTARRALIIDVVRRHLPPGTGLTLVEVGCGTGGNLSRFKAAYRAVGVELSAPAAEIARRKTGCAVFVGNGLGALGDMVREIDGVLLLDLLEHLSDPVAFLREVRRLMPDRARLVITVPAGQWLFSEHDLAFGHLRRYSAAGLARDLRAAGFAPLLISHFNTLLSIPAIGTRLVRKLILPLRRGAQYTTDFWMPPRPVNAVLERIMAAERFIMRRRSIPFGLSIISIAGKA